MAPTIPLIAPVLASAVTPALDPQAARPPLTERKPKIVGLHGDRIEDPYFWLRERTNPAVLAHLQAENAYTAAVTAPLKGFEDELYREMIDRIQQTDISAPYLQRGYWLYQRTQEGKQYPILCRKKGSLDAPEQVVLDINQVAEGHPFMALGVFEYSDDNSLLAYSTDSSGHRDYDFHLKNLTTGAELKTPIGKVADVAWAADNRTLFFITEDEAKRSNRLWRYTLGDKEAALIFEEKNELYELDIDRSRDGKYLFAGSASSRTTEFRFLRADQPMGEWRLIAPRRDEIEYFPEHRNGLFYIRTNDGAKEFRVVTAPVDNPEVEHWQEYLPGSDKTKLEDFAPFATHAVIVERTGGLPQFRILDFSTKDSRPVPLPESAYDAGLSANPEFNANGFRYTYESPVTPPSVYEYRFATGAQTLVKQRQVLGGYDPSRYRVDRVSATAADGTQVPLDIVRRTDVALDGRAPLWLYGYGSYGIPVDPSFSSSRISLLDRGVIYAIAHVRGGGELGEAWHDAGRMMTKKNTFTDFIACADYLVSHHFTTHDRTVIEGGSAGGLLIGATLNLRPDICRAAVLDVPFVDVLNTMSDPTLPLTTGEYIEWGNPNHPDEYRYIKSYSPYDNLAAKPYPTLLILTSLNDSQVPYWEPAKYAAKVRRLKTDKNPVLLRVNLAAGHGGASGRYDQLKEGAFIYAFGLAELGSAQPVGFSANSR